MLDEDYLVALLFWATGLVILVLGRFEQVPNLPAYFAQWEKQRAEARAKRQL